jgi:AraC-like DNA-binding protein
MAGMDTPLLPDPPTEDFWASSDPLGEVLHLLRMGGTFYALSELTAPWGMEMPPLPNTLMFHVVTEGRCWLEMDEAPARVLQPGTLALVPHGRGHRLVSEAGGPADDLFAIPRVELSDRYELIRHGGGGAPTTLVCGAVHFDDPAARQLMDLLPPMVCVDGWSSAQVEWLHGTLRFMATEAKELRPGGETVITRLADVLVIQALRTWMATDDSTDAGWIRALRDPRIGRAIALVHRDPAEPWSVESLATAVGMSRSGFAARFRELAGETPMQYVTRWRMMAAVDWLREPSSSIVDVAERAGYRSEAAFSRAFKRAMGIAPGAVRRGAAPPPA